MEQKYYSIIEMGFTGAVVLGFAIWQLVSINREIARDKIAKDGASKAAKDAASDASQN